MHTETFEKLKMIYSMFLLLFLEHFFKINTQKRIYRKLASNVNERSNDRQTQNECETGAESERERRMCRKPL